MPLEPASSLPAATIVEAWNESRGSAYQVRESDLEWNLTQQDRVHYRGLSIAGVTALVGTATDRGIATGIPRSSLWLSLWGKIPAGHEDIFLNELWAYTLREGREKLVIGGDEYHFVSGVPMEDESDQRLIEALKRAGFQTANEVADFVGELNSAPIEQYRSEALEQASAQGWSLDPLSTPADSEELHQFLAKEFPGRWTREFLTWQERSDTRRAFWALLRRDGEALGFARMAVRQKILSLDQGWTPGALRLPLSPGASQLWRANDSCLGPIGVAASLRGQGAGRVLLGLVLDALLNNDAGRVCIDWTNAFKYYYPLNLDRARTYWTAWRVSAS